MQDTDIAQTLKSLIGQIKDSFGPQTLANDPYLHDFLEALEAGHFHFEDEVWHVVENDPEAAPGVFPAELLLRVFDRNGAHIDHVKAIEKINEAGLYEFFNDALVLAAIHQAAHENNFPVSINISSHSVSDPTYLDRLHDLLKRHFDEALDPSKITFELLEDTLGEGIDVPGLMRMKALGYKFAIDDLTHEKRDEQRLKNLGPYVDFVKIDGQTLQKAMKGEADLDDFIDRIRKGAPQARIIIEWVSSEDQAMFLREVFGINAVQGRDLSHDREKFRSVLTAARQARETLFCVLARPQLRPAL